MDIAVRPDQRGEVDPLAADIPDQITKDRKRGDGTRTILRLVLAAARNEPGGSGDSGRGGGQGQQMTPRRHSHSPRASASASHG